MIIKTPLGLGDAVYCYPIVKHFAKTEKVKVLTQYPIIFENLKVETSIQTNQRCDLKLHYHKRRKSSDNQYTDILKSADLGWIDFSFFWDYGFTDEFKENELNKMMMAMVESRKHMCIIKEPCANHMHKRNNDF